MIDIIPRQAEQSPSSISFSASSESFYHLCESLRLELVIDRWPRREDGPFAVHLGAHEGCTTAYAVEVERFRNGGGGGVESESGGEGQISRRVGRRREGRECEEGRVREVRVGGGELGGVRRRERREVEAVGGVVFIACRVRWNGVNAPQGCQSLGRLAMSWIRARDYSPSMRTWWAGRAAFIASDSGVSTQLLRS